MSTEAIIPALGVTTLQLRQGGRESEGGRKRERRERERVVDRKCVQFGAFCKLGIKPISDQARKRKGRARQ